MQFFIHILKKRWSTVSSFYCKYLLWSVMWPLTSGHMTYSHANGIKGWKSNLSLYIHYIKHITMNTNLKSSLAFKQNMCMAIHISGILSLFVIIHVTFALALPHASLTNQSKVGTNLYRNVLGSSKNYQTYRSHIIVFRSLTSFILFFAWPLTFGHVTK